MTDPECSHCGVLITDHSTMVVRGDQTFCCNNCATAMARAQAPTDHPVGSSG